MSKHKIDFDNIDKSIQSKIVSGSIIPRPIAWITTLNEDGSINLAPFSYFNAISSSLLAVSFVTGINGQKDTLVNILREKEAVIHIVDESLINEMDLTAKPLPKNKSELDDSNLTLSPSIKIKTPGIEEALIRFEVKLVDAISLMDYESTNEEANLVVLRVIASIIDEKVYNPENSYIMADKLNPIARLGGPDYAGIKVLDVKRNF